MSPDMGPDMGIVTMTGAERHNYPYLDARIDLGAAIR